MVFKTMNSAWRALVVAIGYTLALIVSGMVLGMLGLLQGDMNADGAPSFLWMFFGAVIMSLMLGVIAPRPAKTPALTLHRPWYRWLLWRP